MKKIIDNILPEIINIRRSLHQHAELSWQEFETTNIIKSEVEKTGNLLKPIEGIDTGGYVDLIKNENLPFLAFRADIDALPVEDNRSLEYACQTDSVCHACGHDFNAAVGLAIIKLFGQIKIDLNYNIRVIFQPAEEPIPSGALKCIETKLLDNIETIFAIHVEPELSVGTISFAEGWVNAQSHSIDIHFSGKGGHSARLYQADHLIAVAAHFIIEAEDFVKNNSDPDSPAVLAFTGINAGKGYNVLPEKVELKSTFRITDTRTFEVFKQYLENYKAKVKETKNIEVEYKIKSGAPPVIITEEIYKKLIRIYNDSVKVNTDLAHYRTLGGDDFGWFLTKLPGALIRIGIKNKSFNKGLHQPGFNANDDALTYAIDYIINLFSQWI